jgi:hypothetical protein
MEMERRQAGLGGDRLQVERVVEAPRDQLDRALNGLLVVRQRVRLHGAKSI